MSRYADFSNGAQEQVASNLGWTQFGDWLDRLPPESIPALKRLYDSGESSELKEVLRQLENALRAVPPSDDVKHSAELLLQALRDNPTARLTITS